MPDTQVFQANLFIFLSYLHGLNLGNLALEHKTCQIITPFLRKIRYSIKFKHPLQIILQVLVLKPNSKH